jgi:hypothetical protein
MDLKRLKEQFPYIIQKSESWFYNEKTKKWIHSKNISNYLSFIIVNEIDSGKVKFKQIDSFKQKRK